MSVFFPAYNDAPSLPGLLEKTFAVLRRCVADYEVIVVDDGSADDTAQVLERLREKYAPYLRVVTHPENRGYGAALRSGFANARKEFIFYTDGDGQYDPSELVRLLKAVRPDTGLVNGYKEKRHDPWHRVAIGWLYNKFARRLFGVRLRDVDCDFRLIRRSVLQECKLTSTSGTICVELVRRLEMSGAGVVELPVQHYPRLHGSSQFFRLRSLLVTFVQLCVLFSRVVLAPWWQPPKPGAAAAALTCLAIALLAFLPYARALWLPFIADDYVQITLAREFGPSSGWAALSQDVLYRCRATSMILTYWTERCFGISPFLFNLSGVAIHILNSLLVFAMGMWRPIGWRVSAVAACFFAVSQRHHEAVIWYSAQPELLVFLFSVSAFLCWVAWLQSERKYRVALWCSVACFMAALASKESAVVVPPLLVFAVMLEKSGRRAALLRVLPFALLAAAYFGMTFAARKSHLHFNDAGTFSLNAPFLEVMLRSAAGLLWIWGAVALAALLVWRARRWMRLVAVAATWMAVTFLPYSFLTYMPRVPSRHTYLASVGLALLVAAALLEFHARTARRTGRAAVAVVAFVIVVHQCSYLWVWKHTQFERRAWPTEELLRIAARERTPIRVRCFPYDRSVADFALQIRGGEGARDRVILPPAQGTPDSGVDLCTEVE